MIDSTRTQQQSRLSELLAALREDRRLAARLHGRAAHPSWWYALRLLFYSRGLKVLTVTRISQACDAWQPQRAHERVLKLLVHVAANFGNRLSQIIAKSEVSTGAFEGGVYLSDGGHMIIGVRSVGAGTVIHDHVTIGRGFGPEDRPRIGRDVWIGPHSVIYGKIEIGDGATILPHTVVSRNVPAGFVVQGNPATFVRRGFDNARLRSSATVEVEPLLREATGT